MYDKSAHWVQFLLPFSVLHILPWCIMHNCTPFLSHAVQHKSFTSLCYVTSKYWLGDVLVSEVFYRSKKRWLISSQVWKIRLAEYFKGCWDDFSDIICLCYHQWMPIKDFLMILNGYLYAKKGYKNLCFSAELCQTLFILHHHKAEYNWKKTCI